MVHWPSHLVELSLRVFAVEHDAFDGSAGGRLGHKLVEVAGVADRR